MHFGHGRWKYKKRIQYSQFRSFKLLSVPKCSSIHRCVCVFACARVRARVCISEGKSITQVSEPPACLCGAGAEETGAVLTDAEQSQGIQDTDLPVNTAGVIRSRNGRDLFRKPR